MEYNTNMIAYDVPFSALFFILYAGVPVEEYIVNRATEEENLAYIEMLRKIQESKNE
jgi:hypothetical protein